MQLKVYRFSLCGIVDVSQTIHWLLLGSHPATISPLRRDPKPSLSVFLFSLGSILK